MGELRKLPNVGPKIEEQLHQVGIDTPEQLRAVGSREAWLRIQAIDPSACLMRLRALEGAVLGINDGLLEEDVKAALRTFYHEHKVGSA